MKIVFLPTKSRWNAAVVVTPELAGITGFRWRTAQECGILICTINTIRLRITNC